MAFGPSFCMAGAMRVLARDRKTMIIDSHCHYGKGDGLTGPWDTSAPLGDYLRRANAAKITHTVLFPAFHSDYALANREVARVLRSQPNRFYGFAFVHPERDRGRIGTLIKEAVERHGFRGIKVHRYDARITREICEVARAYRLPVLYDVMGEVSVVELISPRFAARERTTGVEWELLASDKSIGGSTDPVTEARCAEEHPTGRGSRSLGWGAVSGLRFLRFGNQAKRLFVDLGLQHAASQAHASSLRASVPPGAGCRSLQQL